MKGGVEPDNGDGQRQFATLSPPPGVTAAGMAEIYTSAIEAMLAGEMPPYEHILLRNTTSAGLLQDARLDGSEPLLLPAEIGNAIGERISDKLGIPLSLQASGDDPMLPAGTVLITLGRVTWADEAHVSVPISRYINPAPHDARV